MSLPLQIERMLEEDLHAVVAIEEASFKDPWYLQSFRSELLINDMAIYLVARLEGKIIAYIGAWLVVDEVHITTLAVDPLCRRCGAATALLQALLDIVLPRGAAMMTLEVRPSNTAAINFYLKHGFTERGRRKFYYRDEDALIMTNESLNSHPNSHPSQPSPHPNPPPSQTLPQKGRGKKRCHLLSGRKVRKPSPSEGG